ncbi:ABC transporter ATP-binding protein [Ochrobactrum sp. CM-21-5]|nr:ABC transporter ATP-binding protein [Ochrobactrum sp. CM-21-5]MBC2886336.1 ABC transporter ATP-binding protein [Ochrobactrum sp. CM-21-5]
MDEDEDLLALPCDIALAGEKLSFASNDRTILDEITCEIRHNRITALLGPNGSGKSTLMRLLMRLEKPTSGHVRLFGEDVARMNNRAFARQVAFLPQDMQVPSALTVRELVGCGRHPHRPLWRSMTDKDHSIVEAALTTTSLLDLSHRTVGALSGGERQRALIAMALAQETDILMLDEPTTYLDIHYQIEILELIRKLQTERSLTICWILHDLNEAAAYSDDVIVISNGRCVATGTPEAVLTSDLIKDVFKVEMLRLKHPDDNMPILIPSRRQ